MEKEHNNFNENTNSKVLRNISIHPTVPAEANELADIQREAFRPLYEQFHDEGNPCLRGSEDILKRLNDNYRHFTITCNGIVVGGIFYRLRGQLPTSEVLKPGEYYLQRVYIKPEYQGMEIAREAILMCEKSFTDAIAFYVDFPDVLDKNRMCYKNAGYSDTGKRIVLDGVPTLAVFKKTMK